MNRHQYSTEHLIESLLGLFKSPPMEDIVGSRERTLRRLGMRAANSSGPQTSEVDASRESIKKRLSSRTPQSPSNAPSSITTRVSRRLTLTRIAACFVGMLLASAAIYRTVMWPDNVYAVFEATDGSVYRMTAGGTLSASVGDKIGVGTPVRTESGADAVLKLPDGSRIEIHPKSEFSLERAQDGLRIRLNEGSVNVTAAKEAAGKLYVQNKEHTVPVVGALFQSAEPPRQEPNSRYAFEVVSIRPANQGTAPGERGGGGGINVRLNGCAYAPPEVGPRRFAIADTNVWTLITIAYSGNPSPQGCTDLTALNLVSGGPGWIKSDKWDIQAIIPEGLPNYTAQQLRRGEAPEFRKMVLTLLEDRFQLVLRREMKEVAAYVLTAEMGAPRFIVPPMYAGGFDDPAFKKYVWDSRTSGASPSEIGIVAKDASMAEVTTQLARATGRPVLDRTGITGPVSFILNYDPRLGPTSAAPAATITNLGQPFAKGLEQIGFRLSDTKTTVEAWVIERVEKPSEN